ncbi:MAG: MFS transporter [Opitutaceae bacterium]|nr:MFS transporter [Opitutaceae bacterium]
MRLERLRWLLLLLLFLSTVINYVDRQALSVLIPTLRTDLGLSATDYGLVTTVFLLAYTVGQLAAGVWIDRVGTRLGFAVFAAVWSLAAVLHAFTAGVLTLIAFRLLLGLTEAGNWPAGTKAIAQWFPQKRRAFAMAVFDGGSAAGAILAPPLVAFLALQFNWRMAFIATGILGFIWVVAWLVVYETPDRHRWLNPEDRDQVATEAGASGARAPLGSALARLLRTRALWGLMLTRLLATPVWWFYVFWLPDYLSQSRGFSLKDIGLYAWIPYVAVDLGKMLGGAVSDRLLARGHSATLARKSVMVFGALLMVGGVKVAGADSAAAAIVWVCVATFGFGCWSANILALHADIFPAGSMATAVGATGTAASLSGAAFTYLVGQIVGTSGYGPVFWAVGTTALVACAALVFVLGRVERLPASALSS